MSNNDIILVKFVFGVGGRLAFVLRTYEVSGVVGVPDMQDLVNTVRTGPGSWFRRLMTGPLSHAFVHAKMHYGLGADPPATSAPLTGVLFNSNDRLPPAIAGLISLYPTDRKPRQVSRVYVPNAPRALSTNLGRPSTTYNIRLSDLAVQLLLPVTFGGTTGGAVITPVVFNREDGSRARLTQFKIKGLWATQRRRGHANTAITASF